MSRARKHDYQGIAALGRGEDSMLVHMTPHEVHSLQALAEAHGGSLTINPDTGYPEAGILGKLLPMLAGVGLSLIPGVGPIAAAAMVGAGSAVAKKVTGGTWGNTLKSGIMGAVGGYGGAQIGSGLMAAGSKGAASAGANALTGAGIPDANSFESIVGMTGGASEAAGAGSFAGNASQALSGAKSLYGAKDFSGFVPASASNLLSGGRGLAIAAGLGLAPALLGAATKKQPKVAPLESPFTPYVGPWTASRGKMNIPDREYYNSGYSGHRYFPDRMAYSSPNAPTFYAAEGGGIASLPGPQEPAPGAVEGMLSGPGDGMSDSIPANIDGKQEARLSDGEFVLPADVVSHLGNGSSKSGSQRLYAMMDSIRQARTGNPDQGKQINPGAYLPA
jgi:hypothetical protein